MLSMDRTPRYRRVLEVAEDLARQFGHDYVGTEHLFLAIIADRDAVPTQVLAQIANPSELAARLRDFMNSGAYRS